MLLAFAVAGAFAALDPFSRSLAYGGSLATATVMLAVALVGLLGCWR
ncbi:MAG TPA: hypothetical protein VFE63_14780 [Roseiarcus sp.]|nr:hypothetical protein [Roseiarcus sp.]